MASPDLSLLATRRFGPIFAVQFMGAFNDNLIRFALVFLATFTVYKAEPARAETLATVSAGLFTLPYFLLSSVGGQLADGMDKARLVRWVKLAEIAIMAVALVGFRLQSVPLLLGCVVAMGVHSTIFGPVKYSILPQHLAPGEIMAGTGLIEAGTFLAILTGQLLGGLVAPMIAGLIATAVAVAGLLMSFLVPPAPAQAPLRVDPNLVRGTVQVVRAAVAGRGVWGAILGISWFFTVGTVVTAQLAALANGTLRAGPDVVVLFLLVFSVGVALGSLLVSRLVRGQVSARFVPAAAFGMAASLMALWASTRGFAAAGPVDWRGFVAQPQAWLILASILGLAVAGGMFVVPLYALLQTAVDPATRSRVIAANNILNAVATVAVVAVVVALQGQGVGVPGVILGFGVATLAVGLLCRRLLRTAPKLH